MVLKVDLHDLGRIAAIGQSRRLEGDGADGDTLAPSPRERCPVFFPKIISARSDDAIRTRLV
jgi:hypothetical protein